MKIKHVFVFTIFGVARSAAAPADLESESPLVPIFKIQIGSSTAVIRERASS